MGKRRISRELSLQILYQLDITSGKIESIIIDLKEEQGFRHTPEIWEYAQKLALGTYRQMKEIDMMIADSSDHWELERIGVIDRNILRQAIYEMHYAVDLVPPNVCINEAIELAKKFSSQMSPAYINGVLDKVKEKVS